MATKRMLGLAGVVLALGLVAPTAAPGASSPGVRVIGENDQRLATFKSAKCTKTKHFFHAEAFSTDGQYELDAFIRQFTGFHKYDGHARQHQPLDRVPEQAPGPHLQQPVRTPLSGPGLRSDQVLAERQTRGDRLRAGDVVG